MGVMEKSKSVMVKSWNSVFRFLWEPCTVRYLLTVKLNIIFFLVRLEFSTLPGGIDHTHAAALSVSSVVFFLLAQKH